MSNTLLGVKGLHAGYGRAEVLTGLNFGVAEGQVVSIIGPNGAGKSTTLNALMGVLPARGRIVFDGQDLAAASWKSASCSVWRWCPSGANCSAACRWKTISCSAATVP